MGKRPYWEMLLFTALAGIVATAACVLIWQECYSGSSGVLCVALCFGAVFLISFAAVTLCEALYGRLLGQSWRVMLQGSEMKLLLLFLCGLLGTMLVSAGFEMIYELGGARQTAVQDRYIFVVDNSGSMSDNDPQDKRFDVIADCIQKMTPDKMVSLYVFNADVYPPDDVNGVTPQEFGTPPDYVFSEGGTDIYSALSRVCDDCEANNMGEARVILLSDGACGIMSSPFFRGKRAEIVKRMAADGITLCAVGFGSPDRSLLTYLAEETDGAYFDAENVSGLVENTTLAVSYRTARTLLTRRSAASGMEGLLTLERIVFICIIGALICFCMILATLKRTEGSFLLWQAVGKSAAAGLAVELGFRLGAGQRTVFILLCMLLCLWLMFCPRRRAPNEAGQSGGNGSTMTASPAAGASDAKGSAKGTSPSAGSTAAAARIRRRP